MGGADDVPDGVARRVEPQGVGAEDLFLIEGVAGAGLRGFCLCRRCLPHPPVGGGAACEEQGEGQELKQTLYQYFLLSRLFSSSFLPSGDAIWTRTFG